MEEHCTQMPKKVYAYYVIRIYPHGSHTWKKFGPGVLGRMIDEMETEGHFNEKDMEMQEQDRILGKGETLVIRRYPFSTERACRMACASVSWATLYEEGIHVYMNF